MPKTVKPHNQKIVLLRVKEEKNNDDDIELINECTDSQSNGEADEMIWDPAVVDADGKHADDEVYFLGVLLSVGLFFI